jgi:hypothetical protein
VAGSPHTVPQGLTPFIGNPSPGTALGLGNFALGHIVGQFSAALGCFIIAAKGGQIEPLVGLNQITTLAGAARGTGQT